MKVGDLKGHELAIRGACALYACTYIFMIWRFPKIRGTFLGVPMLRTIVFGALLGVPLFLGSYHMGLFSSPINEAHGLCFARFSSNSMPFHSSEKHAKADRT